MKDEKTINTVELAIMVAVALAGFIVLTALVLV
jgi:hypothetical protein